MTRPTTTAEGLHAPALRFGDPRVMAVLPHAAVHPPDHRIRQPLPDPARVRAARHPLHQPARHLRPRRLRRKQIIERLPGTHRYRLTPHGRAIAVLFTKTHGRILTPALTALSPALPDDLARRSALATAWRQLDRALGQHITAGLAAA